MGTFPLLISSLIFTLVLVVVSGKKYYIVGAGPNGLYAALRILETCPEGEECHVVIIDKRPIYTDEDALPPGFNFQDVVRPQVLFMALCPVLNLPPPIQEALWTKKLIWRRIKTVGEFRVFCIGQLQMEILKYLKKTYNGTNPLKTFKFTGGVEFRLEMLKTLGNSYDVLFLAIGSAVDKAPDTNIADIRAALHMNLLDPSIPGLLEKEGISLTFNSILPLRPFFTPPKFLGGNYIQANDKASHAQVYFFQQRDYTPEFKEEAAYHPDPNQRLRLNGFKNGDRIFPKENDKDNFAPLSLGLMALTKMALHAYPAKAQDMFVYYAERKRFAYDNPAEIYQSKVAEVNPILVFGLGDFLAVTDYQGSKTLGRGLMATDKLLPELFKLGDGAVGIYRALWSDLRNTEFNDAGDQNPEIELRYTTCDQKV